MSRDILVVEDEIKITEILKDYLVSAGYRVSCLDNGDLLLPHVKQNRPDLILLDIMIPGINGWDVCRGIRQFSNVPIIMILPGSKKSIVCSALNLAPTTTFANLSVPGRSWRV